MKKHMKKIAATLLAFLMLVNVLVTAAPPEGFDWAMEVEAATLTATEFQDKLQKAKALYPDYTTKYEWSVNGSVVGWECHGYGRWLSYYVWGVDFNNGNGVGWSRKSSTVSSSYIDELCPGDVVRYRNGENVNHTIFVTGIDGDIIYYTDCNSDYKNTIKWNQTMTKSALDKKLKQILYGEEANTRGYGYIAHYKYNNLVAGSTTPSTPSIPTSGVESYLFDSGFYYSKYKSEFDNNNITTPEALYNHYLNFGIKEGRCASVVFDPKYYLNAPGNEDLKAAFGDNYTAAREHFISSGCNEYRKSSVIYDGTYYGNEYSDISGFSSIDRLNHFWNNGIHEGRSASATFDFDYYKAISGLPYSDEQKWAYYAHYMYYDYPNGILAYDTKSPTGSNLKVYEVTKDGYWVSCKIEDVSGVSKVQFPTWRSGESTSTAIWYTGTFDSSTGLAKAYIPISDFNNIEGRYHTDVYATDKKGNFGFCCGTNTYIDRTNPVIESFEFTDVSADGYTVICEFSDNIGVSAVKFPTWTLNEQADIQWYEGSISGNTAAFYVKSSDHVGNSSGKFWTHVYVYDDCGNEVSLGGAIYVPVDNTSPEFDWIKVSNITSEGYLVTCHVSDDEGIESVSFPTNPIYEPSDGADWNWLPSKYAGSTGTYYCYVKTSDFDGVTGETYHTHAYVYDTSGNNKCIVLHIDVPADKPSENIGDMFWATARNIGTDKYLTDGEDSNSPSGHNAFLKDKLNESPTQMWLFYLKDNGYYEIMNWNSGLLLTVNNASATCNESVITQSPDSNITKGQEWSLTYSTDGYYAISPACGMSMALDEQDTDIILFDNYCGINETFEITPISLIEELNVLTDEVLLSVDGKFDMCSNTVITPEDAYIKTLRYVSEDESVAKVSADGMITAVGIGITRVLVYPTDGTVLEYIDENGIVHNETYVTVTVVEEIIPATGVVLSSDEKKIAVGETASVFATVLPENNTDNPTLAWSSSNENVAIVKNGLITAVGVGNAEITVTAGGFTSVCNVTVVKPITSLEIMCNDTVTINNSSAFIAPVVMYPPDTTDAITWISSDESVAVVDENGNVTAVGAGECTITASAGGLSSDFGVEVPMVETTALVINTEDAALAKGESLLISKVVYPYNSTDKIIWTSSDESVATVVDGIATAVGAGECTITATSGNCSESFNLIVFVPAESIALDKTSLEIKVGESYTFSPTITPADTTDTLFWYTDEPEDGEPVAVIDENGNLTAKRGGTTTVIAAIGDYYDICEVTVLSTFPETIPTLTAASGGYNSIALSWEPVEGAVQYDLWISTSANGTYTFKAAVDGTETSYINTGRTTNKTYYYKLRALNEYGEYTQYSEIASAKALPAQVQNAKAARASYNSIKVSWSKVSGASGYVVYRATAPDGTYSAVKTITSGSTVSYTNGSLTCGKTYYYKVRAYRTVSGKKVYGDYSEVVSAYPYLTKPTVTVSKSSYYLTVKWNKIGGATGYKVYRSTDPEGEFTLIKTITSGSTVSMNNTSVVPGVTYYYKVVATRGSAASEESAVKSATPTLAKPTSVLANRSSYNAIKTTWKKVAGASGYVIYRSDASDGEFIEIARVSGSSTLSYNDVGVDTGKSYYYKVAAYRTSGGLTGIGTISAADPGKATLGTVSSFTAKRNSYDSVKLTWKQLGGADGYYIYRATSKSGTYTQHAKVEGGDVLSFIDDELVTGKYYYYKVKGYRIVNGEEVLSASYTAYKSARGTLSAPVVTAKKVASGKAQITVKPIDGADGYYVYRSTSKSGTYTNVTSKCTQTTDENGNIIFTYAGQTKGKTYYYKVRAYHVEDSGNVYSAYCSYKACKV